ncbi:BREX-2 system adenine-specific DNA-methyltransferase PglX [Actinomadura decatromicini]|nr:BREX-2 system adenine-specific DNA-methyltransferase PglX [Actinomadura decatromicini]
MLPSLLAEARGLVRLLEDDLQAARDRADLTEERSAWERARAIGRTAMPYETWLDARIADTAMAWVVGSVLLRYCEDNDLIEQPYITGWDGRADQAERRQADFFSTRPESTHRDWLLAGFKELEEASGGVLAVRDHLLPFGPSHDAAKSLIGHWRRRDREGELVFDFSGPDRDLTFVTALYQDVSEHAKKTYALMLTAPYVVDLILDLTLKPALETFGLDELRMIDPVCGQGSFLAEAFQRIFEARRLKEPGAPVGESVRAALASVHGVDVSPVAVLLSRFRLLIAAMRAGGLDRLAEVRARKWPFHIVVGDSLLDGSFGGGVLPPAGSYHVVVGQPPYLTVKDRALSDLYRRRYTSCTGSYSLTVPFSERFFELARTPKAKDGPGYVGYLSANAFMKREFGRRLIEDFFARRVTLSHVIDSSGAYIPGHGVPTVILVGRPGRVSDSAPVRAVVGLRSEPETPAGSDAGRVWRSIVELIEHPGKRNAWVETIDLPRARLTTHPWQLSGGRTAELLASIEAAATRLKDLVDRIGYVAVTGADDVFVVPHWEFTATGREPGGATPVITGSGVRDWRAEREGWALPRADAADERLPMETRPPVWRRLWPYRTMLGRRTAFGATFFQRGRPWFEWNHRADDRGAHPWSIVFSWVATHNHFALLRENELPLHSAPVVKLPKSATEYDHFELLALLNSSAVCFWLKQYSTSKGATRTSNKAVGESWADAYEFTSTQLRGLPVPEMLHLEHFAELADSAAYLEELEPDRILARGFLYAETLADARDQWESMRHRMVALQEELDWTVYARYGLVSERDGLTSVDGDIPEIRPGERAFEIVLARKMDENREETSWFGQDGMASTVEIPSHWPTTYRRVVERRIQAIEARGDLAVLERPEYKRRWVTPAWEARQRNALREWLLDRCARRELWTGVDDLGMEQPVPQTVHRLVDRLRQDPDVLAVASLYAPDADLDEVVSVLVADTSVPFLAQMRLKGSGLRKFAEWQQVWAMQDREDMARAAGDTARAEKLRDEIPLPPKYTSADFVRPAYWRQRGKSDIPKERFISYPAVSPEGDPSLLLGWAGWSHKDRAQALVLLIEERGVRDGWGAERLVPLLAGLAELLPWVRRWSGEVDPTFGMSPADAYTAYLEDVLTVHGVSMADLQDWRPEPPRRGRPRKVR